MITIHLPPGDPQFVLQALEIAGIDPRSQGVMYILLEHLPRSRRGQVLADLIEANDGRIALIVGAPNDLDQPRADPSSGSTETADFPSPEELRWMFGAREDGDSPAQNDTRLEEDP